MIFKIVFLIVVFYIVCVIFRYELMGVRSYPAFVDRSHQLMPHSIHDPLERLTYSANFSTQQSPFNVYSRDCDDASIDLKLFDRINTDVVLLQRFKNSKFKMEGEKKLKFVSHVESESNFNWLISTEMGRVKCAIGIQARQSITVEKYTHHTMSNDTTLSVLVNLKGKPLVLSCSLLASGIKTLSNIQTLMGRDQFMGLVAGIHLDVTIDSKPSQEELIKSIAESLPTVTCISSNSETDLVLVDVVHKYDQLNDGISTDRMGTLVTLYTSITSYFDKVNVAEYASNLTESMSRAICID